jgi:hypothetical protein
LSPWHSTGRPARVSPGDAHDEPPGTRRRHDARVHQACSAPWGAVACGAPPHLRDRHARTDRPCNARRRPGAGTRTGGATRGMAMHPGLMIMFSVAAVLRLGSLAVSRRHEKALKAQGAREYGHRTSRLLALAHTLFSTSGHSPKGSGGARSPRPGRRWASSSTAYPSSRLFSSGAR